MMRQSAPRIQLRGSGRAEVNATKGTMMSDSQGSILLAMIWMALISLLLFWLPLFGPLIAGIVGGKTAGSVGRGFVAALLPSVLMAVLLFLFGTLLTGVPLLGLLAGAGIFVVIVFQSPALIVGALIGGLLA